MPMFVLKHKDVIPPGGWRFFVKESGATIENFYFNGLVQAVRDHLTVNGWETPENIEAIIENQICENIPASMRIVVGAITRGTMPAIRSSASVGSVLPDNFGRTAVDRTINLIMDIRRRLKQVPLVDSSTAERRAARAAQCSYKVRSPVCYSCKYQSPVDQTMGKKLRTSQDNLLHICGVFGCYQHTLVWIGASALEFYISPARRVQLKPDFWLYPELNIKE